MSKKFQLAEDSANDYMCKTRQGMLLYKGCTFINHVRLEGSQDSKWDGECTELIEALLGSLVTGSN